MYAVRYLHVGTGRREACVSAEEGMFLRLSNMYAVRYLYVGNDLRGWCKGAGDILA